MRIHRPHRPKHVARLSIIGILVAGSLLNTPTATVRAGATVVANLFTDPPPGACATSGAGNCSLREAVLFANTHANTTITLLGGTYLLTIPFSGSTDGSAGALALTNTSGTTTINGAGTGSGGTVIDGSQKALGDRDRDVTINGGVSVSISGVTIQGGTARMVFNGGGGGISNSGTLTVSNSTISGNSAGSTGVGGGILNAIGGTLTMSNSTVTGNTALYGGGIGTIHGSGSLTFTASTLSNNTGSGGGIYNDGATITFTGGAISDNTGVGVYTQNTSTIMFDGVMIRGNTGGGIYGLGGDTITVTNSTITDNHILYNGGDGGGILSAHILTLTNSTVSGNSVEGSGSIGAGLFVNHGTISNSTISGNYATNGSSGDGIIAETDPTKSLTVVNSTISGNTGSGIANLSSDMSSQMTVTNVTVAANDTGLTINNGTTRVANSLFANTGNNCTIADSRFFVSGDYNLSSDHSCDTFLTQSHDSNGVPVRIGPLADNGGTGMVHTFTHALLPGSPAIDKIPGTGGCNNANVTTDQRGIARPQPTGGRCDIGAYEALPPPTPLPAPKPNAPPQGSPPAPLPVPAQPNGPVGNIPNPLPPRRP